MLRALEKNVDRRYHSAGEMLQALRSYHDATTSRAGTFDIRRLVRAARSPKVAVPALIALVAAGFLGSWRTGCGTGAGRSTSRGIRPQPARARQGRAFSAAARL